MNSDQFWQALSGVLALLIAIVGALASLLWSKLNNWVRNHETRIRELESSHLKRHEFDGAISTLRAQQTQMQETIASLKTELQVRVEYMSAQGQRLESSLARLEAMMTLSRGNSRRRSNDK